MNINEMILEIALSSIADYNSELHGILTSGNEEAIKRYYEIFKQVKG